MDASGALDSFLGRLTTVLVEEAQLLGRVRGDVEFIKEEMECMNSLILQLTEAQFRDHLVRAWMKQVVGLTRDCEGNVEHYIHYVGSRPGDDGLLGYLRRVLRFLRTIPVRHRIAMRIQELKVRARDVGDRRQRYGVTVPASATADVIVLDVEPSGGEEDHRRRAVLLDAAEPPPDAKVVVRRGNDSLMNWLSATEDRAPVPQVRVFSILGDWNGLAHSVARLVYKQSIFGCKAQLGERSFYNGSKVLEQQLHVSFIKKQRLHVSISQEEDEVTNQAEDMEKRLISKILGHLKGKRFLIVVLHDDKVSIREWKRIQDALLQGADGFLPGSAIIVATCSYDVALSCSPYKIINATCAFWDKKFSTHDHLCAFYIHKVRKLGADYSSFHDIFKLCPTDDTFAMKTFLHLLYVNPNRTEDELENYKKAISECIRLKRSIPKQFLQWCYNELPSKYRSCLLYLTIFPEGHVIRTTSLARRWVAEGLVTATAPSTPTDGEIQKSSSTDEAEHCLDVLFTRGFVSPVEISAASNIKSCTVHSQVREFIARVASDVNFVDSSLPPHLARYLSIHNRIGLQKSHSDGDDSKNFAAYLPSLAAFPQWQLLKVLDLEGCKGLDKKKHLKSICKILLLKYLSLRNTDVAELPKQIKKLQCLETLDIRQTKVWMLSKVVVVLPLLKHFLAGHGHNISESNDSTTFQGSFFAVCMPFCIDKMKNIEILSHVQISNASELAGIAQLLKLRKLGVALHGKHIKLSDLFSQIVKLHRCLRSLSIQDTGMVDPLSSTPHFIERLNVSGITGGFHHLIQEHPKLTKVTLCETQLKEDDLAMLGKLGALRYLKLQHNSYTTGCEMVFREAEFQCLNYLLVEGKDITKISFASGAAPKLERIVWYFARMDALSGLKHLKELKKLELNGDCDLDPIERQLLKYGNYRILKHKPPHLSIVIPYHERYED